MVGVLFLLKFFSYLILGVLGSEGWCFVIYVEMVRMGWIVVVGSAIDFFTHLSLNAGLGRR